MSEFQTFLGNISPIITNFFGWLSSITTYLIANPIVIIIVAIVIWYIFEDFILDIIENGWGYDENYKPRHGKE